MSRPMSSHNLGPSSSNFFVTSSDSHGGDVLILMLGGLSEG